MNIYEKLSYVQGKLKAPKSQFNDFGKYAYRNAEDILEAVKPLCAEVKALVLLTDEVKTVGNRFYVEATAKFVDCETAGPIMSSIEVKANAREEETKKGMDGSQVTGASSSYARKYALNGLFAIDDTKDSDTTNKGDKPKAEPKQEPVEEPPVEYPDINDYEPEMTLEEALAIEVKTRDGVKKLGELSQRELEIGSKAWAYKRWTNGAKVILKSRGLE